MIIDARSRPPGEAFIGLSDVATTQRINERFGFVTPPSILSGSLEEWRAERAAAHVDVTVVVGRNTESCPIPNETLARIQDAGGGGVLAAAGIDVACRIHDPLVELERCVTDLGIHAVAIDPGTALGARPNVSGVPFDAAPILELGAACAELDVPMVCLTGPYGASDLQGAGPSVLEGMLLACPETTVIASHAFYPHVLEAIALAWRHPNLYLCPDLYVTAPGGDMYLDAAERTARQQMIFGSAYPYAGPGEMLSRLAEAELSPEASRAYLGGNASRAFARAFRHLGHVVPDGGELES